MKISNILVATDFSKTSNYAIERGIEIAKLNNGHLTILHAFQKKPFDDFIDNVFSHTLPKSLWTSAVEHKEKLLQETASALSAKHHLKIHSLVISKDKPAVEILNYCQDQAIDFLIIGAHGKYSLRETYIGTTAEYLACFSKCPILIVKNTPTNYKNILIPVDFTNTCKEAVDYVSLLFPKVKFNLLNIVNNDFEAFINDGVITEEELNILIKDVSLQLLDSSKLKMEKFIEDCNRHITDDICQIKVGYPGPAILKDAKESGHDLIVMGAQTHRQDYYINLGSVANYVLRETDQDTLLVPA